MDVPLDLDSSIREVLSFLGLTLLWREFSDLSSFSLFLFHGLLGGLARKYPESVCLGYVPEHTGETHEVPSGSREWRCSSKQRT